MAAVRDNQDHKGLILTQLSGPTSLSFLTPTDSSFPLVLLLGDVHRSEANRCNPCVAPSCYPIESLDFLEALDELAEEYPIDFYTESDPELQRPSHSSNAEGKNVLFRRFLRNTVKQCHHVPMRLSPNYVVHCPTSYIRWHYTDVRTFPHTVEGYLFAPLRYVLEINLNEYQEWEQTPSRNEKGDFRLESFAYLKTKYPKIVYSVKDAGLYQAGGRFTKGWLESVSELKQADPVSDGDTIAMAHVFHVFHESQAFRNKVMEGAVPAMPLSQLILSHLSASHPHLEPYQEQIFHLVWNLFMESSPFKPGGFKEKSALHAFVLSILEVVAVIASFLHRYYESYFSFLRGANAVKMALWKQYQKQTLPVLQDPALWVRLFCRDGLRFPAYLAPFVSLYFYQTFFDVGSIYPVLDTLLAWNKRALLPLPVLAAPAAPAALEPLLGEYGKGLAMKVFSALFQAIIYTEKNMVDLYLLLRMFKRPGKGGYQEEGVPGVLAIAFLGNEHSRHLRDLLLLPELGYREKVGVALPKTNRMSQVSRCIRLPQPLSLRGELEAAAAQMKEWGVNRRNRYRRRVAEENQARGKKRVYQTRKKVAVPVAVPNNNNSMYGYS